jgi:hypothetical protein
MKYIMILIVFGVSVVSQAKLTSGGKGEKPGTFSAQQNPLCEHLDGPDYYACRDRYGLAVETKKGLAYTSYGECMRACRGSDLACSDHCNSAFPQQADGEKQPAAPNSVSAYNGAQ